jgi:competence ComEA-like helix-hairpin-helix protein
MALRVTSVAAKRKPFRIVYAALCVLFFLAVAAFAQKQLPAKPIDLNAANAKELQQLPGVGPVTAQRIIEMREKSGRFRRVEDLLAVRGISRKKLDALKPFVTVSPPPTPSAPAKKP